MLQRRHRRRWLAPALLFAGMFLLSLCFRTAQPGFIPAETARNLWTALRLWVAQVLQQPLYLDRFDIIDGCPFYYETLIRLRNSLVTAGAGAAVCLGGAVFQTMFKNPLASPNILGISTGVNLGNALFIMAYTTQSLAMMGRRYVYCYACAAVLVVLVVGAGKLAGRHVGRFSVVDMLIVGSLVSQFGNVLALYYQYKITEIDYTLLTVYQELSLGIYVLTGLQDMLLFAGGLAVSLTPVLLLRFRLNGTALDDERAAAMGLRPGALRAVGMVCGSVLALTALIHCGDMGILSMAIPCVCRMGRGADFRKVCLWSACLGGSILLFCRSVCSMIYVAGMAMPVNFAISLVVLPAFVLAISKQRSAFE